VILKDAEFKEFAQDFLKDQLWITAEDGGINQNGEVRCIRVVNIETGEKNTSKRRRLLIWTVCWTRILKFEKQAGLFSYCSILSMNKRIDK